MKTALMVYYYLFDVYLSLTGAVAFCIPPSHCHAREGVCDNTATEEMLSASGQNGI